jgi:hypothetical protein
VFKGFVIFCDCKYSMDVVAESHWPNSLEKNIAGWKFFSIYVPCGQCHQHLMSVFAPIFFCQKSSNPKCKYKKAPRKTFLQKSRA